MWVSFANEQHDGAGVRSRIVGQTFLPVLRNDFGDVVKRVDIARERERDHIGRQTVDDATGLLA